jgi:hypothetical protein
VRHGAEEEKKRVFALGNEEGKVLCAEKDTENKVLQVQTKGAENFAS